MKKIILLSVAAIVVLGLVMAGPALLDLYRLQNYIEKSSTADVTDGGPWPRLTDACAGCHGFNGHSQDQRYPSLARQSSEYVAAQLRNFASGQRANPTMGPLAMTLSEVEIKQLSEYFARQPMVGNSTVNVDPGSLEKGRQLVATRSCAACHGDQLMGRGQFPRLAGQGYDYLVEQLDAFAAGTRSEATGAMKAISAAASPDERKAIAAYLASVASSPSVSPNGK